MSNTALIMAHPGHELRVFKFLSEYKPRVYLMTDGSGSKQASRVDSTLKILQASGATVAIDIAHVPDKQIYQELMTLSVERHVHWMISVLNELKLHQIDFIIGDACEGFSPTHDLCRYSINMIASEINNSWPIKNYDFLLDSILYNDNQDDISLVLNVGEFDAKQTAAYDYQELGLELNNAIQKYGNEPFKKEIIRKVVNDEPKIKWNSTYPYYEQFGREQIAKGLYRELITFNDHVLPFTEAAEALFKVSI